MKTRRWREKPPRSRLTFPGKPRIEMIDDEADLSPKQKRKDRKRTSPKGHTQLRSWTI